MSSKITLSHNLMGCRADNWFRLLRDNKITKEHRPQARLMTVVIVLLAPPAWLEWLIYRRRIKATQIKRGPVYVVGYWRSGTTYLQNLLTRDPQFAWFDPIDTMAFNNSILMRPVIKKIINKLLVGARPMDNMEYTQDLPMEEVFAQATISDQAISHMLVFPDGGNGTRYIETAFIDEQSEKKRRQWRRDYGYILKKVTFLQGGKELLLKSPENTCRIGEIKRCYPEAKFINIYRNPYKVVRSVINMFQKEMDMLCLNEPASPEVIEDVAINLFARIYKKALHDLSKIPEGDRIDICYEDFCRTPMQHLEQIYDHLGLDGFEEAKPYFDKYLEENKGYQKNQFEIDPKLRNKINQKLGFYFEHYGYEMITE